MNECIDSLGKLKLFSTLDANSGYWQIEVDKNDIDKTTFVTHDGSSKYTGMSFGLENASAAFQRPMDVVIATVKWQYALVYIADNTIFFNAPEKHLQLVEEVLKELNNVAITIKLNKCSLFSETIYMLSHIIAPGKLHVAIKITEAIKALQYPTTVSEL